MRNSMGKPKATTPKVAPKAAAAVPSPVVVAVAVREVKNSRRSKAFTNFNEDEGILGLLDDVEDDVPVPFKKRKTSDSASKSKAKTNKSAVVYTPKSAKKGTPGKSKGRPKKAVLDDQEDENNFEQVKETPAKTPKGGAVPAGKKGKGGKGGVGSKKDASTPSTPAPPEKATPAKGKGSTTKANPGKKPYL